MSYYEILQLVSAIFIGFVTLTNLFVLFWFILKLGSINKNLLELKNIVKNKKFSKQLNEEDNFLATGYLEVDQKFVVLKNSKALTVCKTKNEGVLKNWKKIETRLLAEEIIIKKDNFYIFQKDFSFSSCSSASIFIIGNISSGWKYWRDENNNETLNHYFRIEDPKDPRKRIFSKEKYQKYNSLKFVLKTLV